MRALLSSRQIRDSSDGSTSAFGSSEPPAVKRTIAAATSSDTSLPPGFITACSACAPVIRASRIRFWVIEGISAFNPSRWAR